jgi:hypothetical protein
MGYMWRAAPHEILWHEEGFAETVPSSRGLGSQDRLLFRKFDKGGVE